MILANTDIHRAIDDGQLIISPEPYPRRKSPGVECPYQTSSVDLHLGGEISYFKEGLAISLDLRRGSFADIFGPNSERREITDEQPYILQPGKFVLGKTMERVELPVIDGKQTLAARVEGRSS